MITSEDESLEGAEFQDMSESVADWRAELQQKHLFEAWQVEAAAVDRSVRILPGVKKLMDSIPEGRYAVATSGARTYGKRLTYYPRERCRTHFYLWLSLRLYDARRHHPSQGDHHRRRQAS